MAEPLTLLEDEFQTLLKMAFPGTALSDFPEGQVREMRRMFMAGAKALHRIMDRYMSPDGGEPTALEEAVVLSIETELSAFGSAVEEGRA